MQFVLQRSGLSIVLDDPFVQPFLTLRWNKLDGIAVDDSRGNWIDNLCVFLPGKKSLATFPLIWDDSLLELKRTRG